jgi:ribonuclease J
MDWPGLVLVAWSAQNLDRLRTIHEAARVAGRKLVVDLYTATLAQAAASADVPKPGDEGLSVYCRRRERIQVKEAGEFSRVNAIHDVRIFPENLAQRARELVLVLRPSMIAELDRAGALDGALAIWSLWRGYLENAPEQRMLRRLGEGGVPFEVHHVSGHAYIPDLRRLVEAVAPHRVIPIHTSEPARYDSLFPRVEPRRDGEWWKV